MNSSTNLPLNDANDGGYTFTREGYARARPQEVTTADVEAATVYGRNDETIGSVRSLKLDSEGKITQAVIDVGGFLGLGAHSVMLPFTELTVLRETNGSDVRVHLDTTKEQLEAMPHHDH